MLLQALHEFAERNRLNDGLAFSDHTVRWVIPLTPDGELAADGIIDLADKDNKKGKTFQCPVTIRSKKAGGVAEFMADGITSLFGLEPDPDKANKLTESKLERRNKNNREKQKDFWRQIADAHEATQSSMLAAMLAWKDKHLREDEPPSFIRWGSLKEGDKEKWIVQSPSGEIALGNGDYFTFQVGPNVILDDSQLIDYWIERSRQERSYREEDAERGFCLVTGQHDLPVMRSHPSISRVPGTLSTGAYLVSFSATAAGDVCAFSSFGWSKGQNAHISSQAAESYAAALNHLIVQSNHHIRLGPAIICFWTKQKSEFTDLLSEILEKPTEQSVANFFKRWKAGAESQLSDQDHFYSVALSGNAGRVVVRRWNDQPLSYASERIERWFNDLRIVEIAYPQSKAIKKKAKPNGDSAALPYGLYRLACTTVRDAKEILADTPVRLFAAALEGAPLPLSWLKRILHRFKCDLVKKGEPNVFPLNTSRFALIKLILIRNRKGDTFMPDVQLTETNDKPYNLGRLMAVLEYLQDKANEFKLEGAGVVEKYYASASAAPVTVFPILLRLCRHHLKKIERIDGGAAYAVERKMESILSLIQADAPGQPPRFPRTLSLEEQGRFALGFYQQKAHDSAQRQNRKSTGTEPETN